MTRVDYKAKGYTLDALAEDLEGKIRAVWKVMQQRRRDRNADPTSDWLRHVCIGHESDLRLLLDIRAAGKGRGLLACWWWNPARSRRYV